MHEVQKGGAGEHQEQSMEAVTSEMTAWPFPILRGLARGLSTWINFAFLPLQAEPYGAELKRESAEMLRTPCSFLGSR